MLRIIFCRFSDWKSSSNIYEASIIKYAHKNDFSFTWNESELERIGTFEGWAIHSWITFEYLYKYGIQRIASWSKNSIMFYMFDFLCSCTNIFGFIFICFVPMSIFIFSFDIFKFLDNNQSIARAHISAFGFVMSSAEAMKADYIDINMCYWQLQLDSTRITLTRNIHHTHTHTQAQTHAKVERNANE